MAANDGVLKVLEKAATERIVALILSLYTCGLLCCVLRLSHLTRIQAVKWAASLVSSSSLSRCTVKLKLVPLFSRQLRAATSSEVIGQSVLFGVTCNGGRCRAGPTAGGAGTPSEYGPRYATDLGPYYAPDQPLDLRAGGLTTQIHINGHRGPAPLRLEPTAGVSRRLCTRGSDSAD